MRPRNFATPATHLSRPVPTRLYLTGLPGSGKSTVGQLLAGLLGYRFVDLDEEVERLAGRSAAALFAEGESTFRAAERRALEEAAATSGMVVATGGGALIDPGGLDLAMRSGAVIYLKAPVATLATRLVGGADRPLLLDENGAPLAPEPLSRRLEEMLLSREPAYNRADIVVEAGEGTPDGIAAAIAARLGA